METITVLECPQERHEEMNQKKIVVCTYKRVGGGEVDAITYDYKDEFPDFQEVLVIINQY